MSARAESSGDTATTPEILAAREDGRFVRRPGASGRPGLPGRLPDRLVAAVHAGLAPVIRLLVRAGVGPVSVHGRERVPRTGGVLVVANHPAMWTDALLLEVALGRRLRFLAMASLFRLPLRGWLLRAYGAIPIHRSEEDPDAREANRDTDRECLRLLARGEAIVTFPEGTSRRDWRLAPFRGGAAWLALAIPAAGPVKVLPVGIHYRQRTAWRAGADVSVGEPLDPGPERAMGDHRSAVEALTVRLRRAVADRIVEAPDDELEGLAQSLLPLLPGEDSLALDTARRRTAALARQRMMRPERHAALLRAVRSHHRRLRAAGLEPEARVAWMRPVDVPLAVLAGVPVAAGMLFHAVPSGVARILARRVAPQPSRIVFGRAIATLLLQSAWYLMIGAALHYGAGWPHGRVALALVAFAACGTLALAFAGWIEARRSRLRWWLLRRCRPDAGARLDASARAVRKLLP